MSESSMPSVKGLRWGAVAAEIRKRGGLDLGLMVSDAPAAAAALFTQCVTCAAPVRLSRERVKAGTARAVLVNAGCANASTPDGLDVAKASTEAVALQLAAKAEEILVASTGVIGARLPVDRLVAAVPSLAADASADGFSRFAAAIMTTDTFPKMAAEHFADAAVLGCAKGAGMIMPNMATMLGFLATDAQVAPSLLRRILADVAHQTFNAVTVDGDTSTNDSLFLLATGRSKTRVASGSRAEKQLRAALLKVCEKLATSIARDGEGATKLITVRVLGARNEKEADLVARRIANSPLVKTAIHAADANWGRIVAAAGTAGAKFDPTKLEVAIGPAVVLRRGLATGLTAEQDATVHLRGKEVTVQVKLGAGTAARTVWTCDLSAEYVKINAEYRT